MQIKFVPVVYHAQFFLFLWVSRHDCIDSGLQGIYADMQINFVRVGCCATNVLWLDLLKPVKFNYLHQRENIRIGRPRGIKIFALDKQP